MFATNLIVTNMFVRLAEAPQTGSDRFLARFPLKEPEQCRSLPNLTPLRR
jgi:hypothetical protein